LNNHVDIVEVVLKMMICQWPNVVTSCGMVGGAVSSLPTVLYTYAGLLLLLFVYCCMGIRHVPVAAGQSNYLSSVTLR
jgi:succinate dehydrogenase/fumarate reductase cytochrome b subunit